jgi:glycerophosphoryl diester phosphodiesterase
MPSSTDGADPDGSAPTSPSRFLGGPRPRRIAHRGLALYGAENTLRAFADALEAGATMLETDTRATADGIALAVHDATLERIADDPRPVAGLLARDLDQVRVAGVEPLARLEDVLGTFDQVPINIDVKDERAISPAVRAVVRTGAAPRICVTSFSDAVADRVHAALLAATGVRVMRSPSRHALIRFRLASALDLPQRSIDRILAPYGALQVPERHGPVRVVSPRTVAAAHRSGAEVQVWTVDDPGDMRRLLAMGVDGLITNRVDLLTALCEA